MRTLVRGFFSQLKRFTLFRKLVLSFMTLLAVFSVLVVALLYSLFTHVMYQEYQYMARNSLVSADSVLQNSYDKLGGVVNEILSFPSLPAFFLDNRTDRVNEAGIFKELRRLKNLYPYIEKISLVNIAGGRYLGTDGASNTVDESILRLYRSSRGSGMVSCRRTVRKSVRLENSQAVEVNTFVFFPTGQYRDSAIVLDLRDEYLMELLNPAVIHPQDQIFLVTNEDVFIGRDEISEEEWRPVFENLSEDHFQIMDISGTRCAVAVRKACIPGWRLARVMPMVGSGILTRRLSVQLTIALLAFLAAASYGVWRMILGIYNPVKTMVRDQVDSREMKTVDEIGLICDELARRSSEIDQLSSRLKHSKILFNSSWVKSQLLGDAQTAKKVESLSQGTWNLEYAGGVFKRMAAVISIDHYRQYSEQTDVGERGLHDFAISNILAELLAGRILGGLIRMDERKLACLIACRDSAVEQETIDALKEFQKSFSAFFKQTVSIGLGLPADTLEGTAGSWEQACTALNYRFYRGTDSLNIYDGVFKASLTGYPAKEEREILEGLLLQDNSGLMKAEDGFLQAIGRHEEFRAKAYAERCVNSLVLSLAARSVLVPGEDLHKEIYAAETMEELGALFARRIEAIRKRCKEELDRDEPGEKNPVILARNYINDHYSKVDLSVEFLAGLVGLSPAYFGKQFYNTLHVSCNDYIADIRLENAARLLRETNMPVQEISSQVGVGSINYFYRLFKKKYGETPVNYRKKKNQEDDQHEKSGNENRNPDVEYP